MNFQIFKEYKNNTDIEYLTGCAEALKLGIFCSTPLYSYLINNFNEILSQDEVVLNTLYDKCKSITDKEQKIFSKENNSIYFYDIFNECLTENGFNTLDCISLGTICYAFVSWKLDLLDMESYYEIRDMFVPFGLNITEDTADVNILYNSYTKILEKYSGKDFRFIVKVGKTEVYSDIISEMTIKDAFNEIYFNEMAND